MARQKHVSPAAAAALSRETVVCTQLVEEVKLAIFAEASSGARFARETTHGMAERTKTGKRTQVTMVLTLAENAAVIAAVRAGRKRTQELLTERAAQRAAAAI